MKKKLVIARITNSQYLQMGAAAALSTVDNQDFAARAWLHWLHTRLSVKVCLNLRRKKNPQQEGSDRLGTISPCDKAN